MFIIVAALGFAAFANAQPKSLGGRVGNYGVDVSYENYVFGGPHFLEFELGLDDGFSTNAFHVDGIYNFMIAQPDWTPSGSWGFYCGPGASVAVWENAAEENVVYVGVVGNVGLEYTFDFPLSLSVLIKVIKVRILGIYDDYHPGQSGSGCPVSFVSLFSYLCKINLTKGFSDERAF